MNKSIENDWFVIQYRPNSSSLAKRHLERQGVETFLPLIEDTKRRSSYFLTNFKPLFPGYMFISFDASKFHWLTINSTVGVRKILAVENTPKIIPKNFIHPLRLKCDPDGKLVKETNFRIGDKARVLKGPFAQMIGRIEKVNKNERITILFEILGRETTASISSAALRNLG